jgi:hypothetical protein
MYPANFKGHAKRLDDVDLPRLGALIGVGEDEIHAVLDVESRGSGFDRLGRPAMLFEPHLFWRELGEGSKRARAAAAGLAWPKWRPGAYPPDSYPNLIAAIAIDETAALRSASWGLGQVLGSNHRAAGYASPQAMVAAFCDDEEAHLAAMVSFIKATSIDDDLRAHRWDVFARVYNGPGYATHDYHGRLARAYARWRGIKDTPWNPADAIRETQQAEAAASARESLKPAPIPAPPAPIPVLPEPAPPPAPGFWARFWRALTKRMTP